MPGYKNYTKGQIIGKWIYVQEVEPKYYTHPAGNTIKIRQHETSCANCGFIYKRLNLSEEVLKNNTCNNCKDLPQGQTGLNMLFRQYSDRSLLKKGKMMLTLEQFKEITSQNCSYCGIEPSLSIKYIGTSHDWGTYHYNGIDRINNLNYNYEPANCTPCCHSCNIAKRDMTVEEFNNWIDKLINFNKEI